MTMDYFDDPSKLRLRGAPRGRSGEALTKHVPIRFGPELLDGVRVLAARDGVSVSSWIRRIVDEEVRRRLSYESVTSSPPKSTVRWTSLHGVEEHAATGSAEPVPA